MMFVVFHLPFDVQVIHIFQVTLVPQEEPKLSPGMSGPSFSIQQKVGEGEEDMNTHTRSGILSHVKYLLQLHQNLH